MTRYALNASASSLFLLDEEKAGVVNHMRWPLGKKYSVPILRTSPVFSVGYEKRQASFNQRCH